MSQFLLPQADQQHQNNADDTRRIIMRAANCQRSPRSAAPAPPPPALPVENRNSRPNPTPLTSTGSTTSSSSGYSSINAAEQEQIQHSGLGGHGGHIQENYACPNNNQTVPVPQSSSSSSESSGGNCRIIPIIKVNQLTI